MTAEINMRTPYNCPYCIQTCTRKWNLSAHIERKHVGYFNPFYKIKKTASSDIIGSHVENKPEFSNSFLPEYNFNDPVQAIEKLVNFQNLLIQIRGLSKMELITVLSVIKSLF